MEEDDSKSQSLEEDCQISLEQFVAENAAEFQERVENILLEIEQDGNFSEMTAELYDEKKSYLTRNLTELSRMHNVLTDQIRPTLRCSTPFGHDSVLTRDCSGFCVSKTEDSKSSISLSSDSGSESLSSTSKLLISPVNNDACKDKETKTPEVLLQKNFNLDEELVSLVDGNTKLKGEIEDTELVIKTLTADPGNTKLKGDIEDTELVIKTLTADPGNEKEVADLKHALSDCNLKNTKMGEELQASKLKVTESDKVTKDLKQQRSIQDSKEIQIKQELQLVNNYLHYLVKVVHSHEKKIIDLSVQISEYEAEISEHDDQITELNKKIKQYTSEISQLKTTHKRKENNWRGSIDKLRKELEKKGESVDDLTKKLDTVQAEKCSQDNLIQELESHLSLLQADHEGVLASSENDQKVTNELTERVMELEREVDMQKEVISVRDKEKREAITLRQLSSSLETVQDEKCSRENLIQELDAHLISLQADHERVLASSENAQKVTNELTERVLELEREVDMQEEVISVRDEEKREVIRQLSSSLDHYKSKYQELHQAFVTKNTTSCFDFLH